MFLENKKMKHLWLFGLRRSGTTAIWKMFRDQNEFTCYDEPFNPKLSKDLPKQHAKGTWDEYINLWMNDNKSFTNKLNTIEPRDEMSFNFNPHSLEYLKYLAVRPTIIDFTRLNFKVDAVLSAFPDAVGVFLYRSPIAFTTSHLINSENRKLFRQRYYRTMFYTGLIGFDSWGLETNFAAPGLDQIIEECRIVPLKPLQKLKSAEKILLLWLAVRRTSQNYIEQDKNGRVFSACYEDIIDGKCTELEQAIEILGMDRSQLTTSHLRQYTLGFRHNDPVWSKLARNAGFNEHEISVYLRHQFK